MLSVFSVLDVDWLCFVSTVIDDTEEERAGVGVAVVDGADEGEGEGEGKDEDSKALATSLGKGSVTPGGKGLEIFCPVRRSMASLSN